MTITDYTLEQLADALRLQHFRGACGPNTRTTPLDWEYLKPSEQTQWLDKAIGIRDRLARKGLRIEVFDAGVDEG